MQRSVETPIDLQHQSPKLDMSPLDIHLHYQIMIYFDSILSINLTMLLVLYLDKNTH